ncbi:MAG TPA: MFS transporter [Candidatus Nanopelagicales bacterium]|nr:MFS transporter [Candidatus Nanopelagicales bacterium]
MRAVRFRDVLAVREYRGIIIAQIASQAGDQIARVALALLVLDQSGSPLLAAGTFAVSFVPSLLGSALLAPIADRFSRRSLMLGSDVGRAIAVGLLALLAVPGTPIWLLFGILFVAELFTPLFDSARMASIPDILGSPAYVSAGSGLSRALNLANQAIGLFVGGLIVQLTTPRVALFLDALSFVISFAVLAVTLQDRPSPLESTPSIIVLLRDLGEGWSALMSDPSRRAFVLLGWALAAPLVAPEAVALAYADDVGEPPGWGGALMAGVVVGAAVGSLLIGRRPLMTQLDLVLPLAIAMGLPLLVTGIEPPILLLLLLWGVSGAAQAFLIPVMSFTTLLTPNEQRGRAVGIAAAGFALFTTIGYLVTGWLATITSPAFAVVVMAVLGLAVAAVAYLTWPVTALRRDVRSLEAAG